MAIIVQKYGGSSVADIQKLRRVAERVMRTRQQGHDVVVVVSAMGDTTDELLALAKQVSQNPDRRELDMLLGRGAHLHGAPVHVYARATQGPLPGATPRATARACGAARHGCPEPSSASPARTLVTEQRLCRMRASRPPGWLPPHSASHGSSREKRRTRRYVPFIDSFWNRRYRQ